MKTITFCNWKGGCGKTTSVWATAARLNLLGYKVLLIDLDPQSNLTYTTGVNIADTQNGLYYAFKKKKNFKSIIQNIRKGLDIVFCGFKMASADIDFNTTGREFLLAEQLDSVKNDYDYCIIDTCPHLGILVINALVASDSVIIPLQADIYNIQGLEQLKGFIDRVRKGYRPLNPNLNIKGLLVTRVDTRTNITKILLDKIEEMAEIFETKIFNTKIRNTVSIGEAALLKADIFETTPKATATTDYIEFVDELMRG